MLAVTKKIMGQGDLKFQEVNLNLPQILAAQARLDLRGWTVMRLVGWCCIGWKPRSQATVIVESESPVASQSCWMLLGVSAPAKSPHFLVRDF